MTNILWSGQDKGERITIEEDLSTLCSNANSYG